MTNFDLPEINLFGERLVEKWLLDNEYSTITKENIQLNNVGFQAAGKLENVLVQVKTFVHPSRPFKLSEYEIDLLTRRATKLKLVAYVAYVVIDNGGNLFGEIKWERLSL